MKSLEQAEAGRQLPAHLPICARLDGRGFSKFTRGLTRPYHLGMIDAMVLTAAYLIEETGAIIGLTQSDEINLILYSAPPSQPFFGGKVQKLTSVLAAMATAKFNSLLPQCLPNKVGALPVFDCRVWSVPP